MLGSACPRCGEVQLHKAHTHANGRCLPPVFLWLNSILLTGRWQFSARLDCDSRVSDCADDVCARGTSLIRHRCTDGLLSVPRRQRHAPSFMFSRESHRQEKGNGTEDGEEPSSPWCGAEGPSRGQEERMRLRMRINVILWKVKYAGWISGTSKVAQ